MASAWMPHGIDQGNKTRYGGVNSDSESSKSDDSDKKSKKKKKKVSDKHKKANRKSKLSKNLSKSSSRKTSTPTLQPKKIDPLLELSSSVMNGEKINLNSENSETSDFRNGSSSSTNISESLTNDSQDQKNKKKDEPEQEEEKYDNLAHELIGNLVVWNPMNWNIRKLCRRRVEYNWEGRLTELELSKSLCYKNNEALFYIIQTKTEELPHFTDDMNKIHSVRQKMRVFTPFLVKGSGTSDFPWPVHVVSECELMDDKQTTKPDICNQKFLVHSQEEKISKVLTTIHPSDHCDKLEILSDLRNHYTDKSQASSFIINISEVDDSLSYINVGRETAVRIKVDSYFIKVLRAISTTGFPSLIEMKNEAERLLLQIYKSKKVKDHGVEWYVDVEYELTMKCKSNIEYIRSSIPKYEILAYRIVPPKGISWTDITTWPVSALKRLGLLNADAEATMKVIETNIFRANLTLEYYYI